MNAKTRTSLTILFIIFGFASRAYPADIEIKIANNGFETAGVQNLPADWLLDKKTAVAPGVRVMIDKNTGCRSFASLLAVHDEPGRSTIMSESIALQVGRLYRLSGWIKTAAAYTDPGDRYPTPVAACLTMASFPFTNHSPSVGGDTDWKEIAVLFVATEPQDRVGLHLGFNGKAKGKAWFDNIKLEEVSDIASYIPMETVRWLSPAFRYDDKGWIFVHIEGKPYTRGYQYGYLLAEEIVSYIAKLAYKEDQDNPAHGWYQLRRLTDALMLRKYDEEFLEEMKGIAAGAAKNGAKYMGNPLDLIDIVAINSVVDIGQLDSGLSRTAHALSGRNFLKAEDEMNIPLNEHKCSGFAAAAPATKNGEIVFGQLFMWNGYTGVHWNVICDLVPEKGNRLVYETFPGGIHSGADIYINSAGIMIGETTVSQTPFNDAGTPQSNRIRKAAQYAASIDDVVRILQYKNNGMYTNDWLLGDVKTNEIAIFLLGTHKSKLWRSSSGGFPGGTAGFLWSNNNNKDLEVRKEYIPNSIDAPYDLVFNPWNRDIEFYNFYSKHKGEIDATAGIELCASSPINRPHACDGKITTSAMAKNLMFLAHFGKVTLREKFPSKESRYMPDYPDAIPHLSLGYSVASPLLAAEKLPALKKQEKQDNNDKKSDNKDNKNDMTRAAEVFEFDRRLLWHNTVYPASDSENWFISGAAHYWTMLNDLPAAANEAPVYLGDRLTDINNQLLYIISREGAIAPLEAKQVYDSYNHYLIPRVRGVYLLHQLRLNMGNKLFSQLLNQIHDRFRGKNMTTGDFVTAAEKIAGRELQSFIRQWLTRSDLPNPGIKITTAAKNGDEWEIELLVAQPADAYHFFTTANIKTAAGDYWKKLEINGAETRVSIKVPHQPEQIVFNAAGDIPVERENFYTWSNFYDDFSHTIIVYGTSRQIEANHTLALRFQTALADRFSEILPPVKKDSEISELELADSDLIILAGTADNSLMESIAQQGGIPAPLKMGKNYFQWQGKTYAQSDDGIFLVVPNPYNPRKTAYLVIANSALQLYYMTRTVYRFPSWALFKKDVIAKQGYLPNEKFIIDVGK